MKTTGVGKRTWRDADIVPAPVGYSPVRRGRTGCIDPLYALVWRRDGSPGIHWYIRCLGPDGFYGEVGYRSPEPRAVGRVTGVRGILTATDRERVAAILIELSSAGPTNPGACFALLGRKTESLGQAEVVFKYELGMEVNCPRARRFLELHTIIETYLAEAYVQITEENQRRIKEEINGEGNQSGRI